MLNHECTKDGVGNVIFLDIDGVLNSLESCSIGELYDIRCARIVKRICSHTDADIVISSSWRIGSSTETLLMSLYPVGLNRVIGRTASNDVYSRGRGDEIQQWIDTFKCTNYVILDDDSFDILESQKSNFVNTYPVTGITHEDSDRAIKILGQTRKICSACDGYGQKDWKKCPVCKGKYLLM